VGQAVAGCAKAFPVADGGVVNDRVEKAEGVRLARNVARSCDRLKVADDDRLGFRQRSSRVGCAGLVAGA
jgi:hypothetical protein